jgi:hypothetical protein
MTKEPNNEVLLDTSEIQPDKAVQQILLKLEHIGYLTGESE